MSICGSSALSLTSGPCASTAAISIGYEVSLRMLNPPLIVVGRMSSAAVSAGSGLGSGDGSGLGLVSGAMNSVCTEAGRAVMSVTTDTFFMRSAPIPRSTASRTRAASPPDAARYMHSAATPAAASFLDVFIPCAASSP